MNQSSSEILERIGDAFVSLDSQWRYTYVNRRAAELLGRSPEELRGRRIWDEFPNDADHPFARAYRRAMDEGVPVQIEDYYPSWDRWFENRIHPCDDGVSIFFTDITERKRAETALQESEQRFRSLVETSPEAIGIAVEGRFAYVNPAMLRLLGAASAEDLLERDVLAAAHPDEHPRIRERLRQMHAGGSVEPDVQRWIRLDGTEIQVEVISSPTTFRGRPAHQSLARDVTERVRAERSLRESEERLSLALSISGHGLWDWNVPSGEVKLSAGWGRMIGMEGVELRQVFQHFVDCLHPEDRDRVVAAIFGHLGGQTASYECEYRLRHHDGRWLCVLDRGRVVERDPQGSPVRVIGILTDISEQKQAEQRLRESEERSHLVMRATNDVVWDYDLVADRVYWGESLATVFGYDPAIQEDGTDWWVEKMHPDDRPRVLARLREALDGGESVVSGEYRFRRRDGGYAIVNDRGLIRRDPSGRPIRMVGSLQDLTAKREAEVELHALFSAMQDVILVVDADGRYLKIAPTSRHLLYRHPDELIGRTFHEVLPAEQADYFHRSVRAALDGARAVDIEYSMPVAGREVWFAASLSPMTENSVLWVARDITERRRAEEALQASERRYREIFEQSRDPIYVRRMDGTLVDVNPAAEEVFGAPRAELLQHPVQDFYADPADREALQREVAARGAVRNYEIRLRRMNGSEFLAVVSTTALHSDGGEVIGYQGTIQDVTERKETERRLRAQEARFRSLIENVHDIITLLDADGAVRYISPSVERALGRPAAEYLGASVFQWVHPDDARGMTEALQQDLAHPGAGRTLEVRVQHRDGAWRRLEVVSLNLLHDPDVGGMVFTARDVTERSTAEEALHRSEAWFRSLTQNALDIISVLDADGRIRYSTPSGARTLRYQEGDLRRRTLLDLVHPEDRAEVGAALARLVDGGTEPVTLTARIQAQDGSWQVHQAVGQSLLHDPAIRGVVINSRDVTDQRQLEQQLVQAQKMEAVGRLAGGVAHDFNNVLMAITGFAALLEGETAPGSEAAEYLAEIHKAAERATSLTRQLLAFGRKQALRPKVVNLNSVVEGGGAMLRRLIRENVELVYRLDPRLGQCRVDPHQVEQVLMNLVVNATDALPEGGTIEIVTRNRTVTARDQRTDPYLQPGSYTAVSVRDTGLGIDPDTLAKIFEPFFTTKEVGRGTGLGLSTVYGIVKQSGGYITVDTHPGEGSTFTVLLPRIGEEQDANSPRGTSPLRRGRGTILLAEDEDAVRLLSRLTLQKAGYEVLEARDGTEALRIARDHPGTIDLLLTDVVMPHLGGYTLARMMREHRPSLRVVYMSGYTGNALRETGLHGLEGDFLAKPITPAALTRRVQEMMAK